MISVASKGEAVTKTKTAVGAARDLRDEMIGAAQVLEAAAKRLREDSRIILSNAMNGEYATVAAVDHFRDFKRNDVSRAGVQASEQFTKGES